MPSTFLRLLACFLWPLALLADPALESEEEWLEGLLGLDVASEDLGGEEEPAFERESSDWLEGGDFLIAGSRWNHEANALFGFGWKENALLSETGEIDSYYERLELDFFAFRPEGGKAPELTAMLYGDIRYYNDVPGMDAEVLAIGQGMGRWSLGEQWRLGASAQGMYSEQAFDASEVDFETQAVTVAVFQPEAGIRLERGSNWEFGVDAGRVDYDQDSESYDAVEGSLRWKAIEQGAFRLGFAYELYREWYDEKVSRDGDGTSVDDRLLEIRGDRFELEGRARLREDAAWEVKAALSYEREDDVLGSYYERERWRFGPGASFQVGEWRMDCSFVYSRISYEHRLVDGLGSDTRLDDYWRWSAQASRPVSESLELLLRYEGANKNSNASSLSYDTSGVFIAVRTAVLSGP